MLRLLLAALAVMLAGGGLAQTPPSGAEASTYRGLHRAAYENDVPSIKALVAEGADPNARDQAGRTPAHVAAFASNDEALRALAAAGADMNALENQAYGALTIAAVNDDAVLVSLALELGNRPDLITSPYDGTALIAAAHLGRSEVVRRLLAAGAPPNHVNNLGWTALIEAVVLGDGGPDHVATVAALLNGGADVGIADRDGVTPLAHARARGYAQMVVRLEAAK